MSARRLDFAPPSIPDQIGRYEYASPRSESGSAWVQRDLDTATSGRESVRVDVTSFAGRWEVAALGAGPTLDDAMAEAEARLREASPLAWELYASLVLVGTDAGMEAPL